MNDDLTNKQLLDTLMQAISDVRKEVNDNIEKSKREIKLENQKLLETLQDHSVKIQDINDTYESIERRCINIEREFKKNNIVIFGLEVPKNKNLLTFTLEKLTELTGVNINESDINNIYQLNKETNAPIKVEFTRFLKKDILLKNCYKLKGSKISIVHDLSAKDREDQKVLRKHLKEARSKHYLAKIKRNALIVNNEIYTVQDLRDLDMQEDQACSATRTRPSSEPTTPKPIYNKIANNVDPGITTANHYINIQETLQLQNCQVHKIRTDNSKNSQNTSPADPKKEEKTKRTNSTSSAKSDKNDRPRRQKPSNLN